ncbi:MAG: tRNA-dihydrouridine synthase [Phycisphaeraceae bacterium]|nr:tRNA-dihydrouridine synthase [Phycisphaerae bacterium]MBX3391892.1 tRNA-dihydrouridine synthase [Phycisphaeraceae bacterium]
MLAAPLTIGPLRLATNLLLAPIAGYCDLSFRTICREQGGLGLACTDLLSPQGLLRGSATSLDLARTDPYDKPIGMQIYGSDPRVMAQGARWAVEHGATVVDINMGCPVDKVTKKDGGSKLLTDLPRAIRIVEHVARELQRCALSADEWSARLGDAALTPGGAYPVPVPLTCKMRLCWSTDDYHAGRACSPHLARSLADAGVSAVTVHGRTTEMKFSGSVLLDGIARVVDAVNGRIPVIGNGDVREPGDAAEMIRRTGCSGVMIGRGALSTPWIFRETWSFLRDGRVPASPPVAEKIGIIRRYFDLMRHTHDDRYALFQINRRVSWFARNLVETDPRGKPVGVKPLKEAIRLAVLPDQVHDALDRFLRGGLRGGFDQFDSHAA